MYRVLRYVPKNKLSRLTGRLVHTQLPKPLARRVIGWFARKYSIDTESAGKALHDYPSIGHFFIRELREGLRPVEGDLVSPVDGVLRNFGPVEEGRLQQIKGKTYSLEAFLGDAAEARRLHDGFYFNLYLSPQDYHHVHSPISGGVVASVHIPGRLWPVNDWSLANVENLFSVNERVVTWIDSERGRIAVVMIGATNVGKISVTYDDFISNLPGTRDAVSRHYDPAIPLAAGAKLGTFHMGSSVVVLLEKGALDPTTVRVKGGERLRYGQALLEEAES